MPIDGVRKYPWPLMGRPGSYLCRLPFPYRLPYRSSTDLYGMAQDLYDWTLRHGSSPAELKVIAGSH